MSNGFSDNKPNAEQEKMAMFRHIMKKAVESKYVGGFPTFHITTVSGQILCTAIYLNSKAVERRDVPQANLGNISVDDFEGRIKAVNVYAKNNGFVGAMPTFHHANSGNGIVFGTMLFKSNAAEFLNIPLSELGNPPLADYEARFRATQDYAVRNHFLGGFPTFHQEQVVVDMDIRTRRKIRATVCGAVLIKQGELSIRGRRDGFGIRPYVSLGVILA